jgi:hypothetical protein
VNASTSASVASFYMGWARRTSSSSRERLVNPARPSGSDASGRGPTAQASQIAPASREDCRGSGGGTDGRE